MISIEIDIPFHSLWMTTLQCVFIFQALLSDKVALQSVLLRHMTRGALISKAFPPGPTPLVTGAGERVTVTAFPNQVTITSVLAVAHIIDVDNEASNGVVHVVDSVF